MTLLMYELPNDGAISFVILSMQMKLECFGASDDSQLDLLKGLCSHLFMFISHIKFM